VNGKCSAIFNVIPKDKIRSDTKLQGAATIDETLCIKVDETLRIKGDETLRIKMKGCTLVLRLKFYCSKILLSSLGF